MSAVLETIGAFMSFELLISLALKSTLILGLAAVINKLLVRASATCKHWVWALAFASLLLLPVLPALVPAINVGPLSYSQVGNIERASLPYLKKQVQRELWQQIPEAIPANEAPASDIRSESAQVNPAATIEMRQVPDQPGQQRWLVDWRPWLLLAWMLGFAIMLLQLVGEVIFFKWLARTGESPGNLSRLTTIMTSVKSGLHLQRPIRLVVNKRAVVPLTFGCWRPVILLPANAMTWNPEQIRFVLLHESAHVKRFDHTISLVAHAICTFYWFNPLVWYAAGRLRAEHERACDDMVLATGTRAHDYASFLLDVVRSLPGKSLLPHGSIAMACKGDLKNRFRNILSGKTRSTSLGKLSVVVSLLILCSVLLPVGAAQLEGQAFDLQQLQGLSVVELLAGLGSENDLMRRGVISVLGEQKEFTAVDTLISFLDHSDPETRAMAAWALGRIGRAEAMGPLLSHVTEPDAGAREMIVRALGQLQARPAVTPLLAVLKDQHVDVRNAAIWSLGEIAERRAFDALAGMLKDPHPTTRVLTLWSLSRIGCIPAFVATNACLKDPDAAIRESAARLLAGYEHPVTVPVVDLLVTTYPRRYYRLLRSVLGEIENVTSLQYLQQALTDKSPGVRQEAERTLGRLGGTAIQRD